MRGGFGGMMHVVHGGVRATTVDNMTDETALGMVYDQKVVVRLASYAGGYKRDALISIGAALLYSAGSVSLPLLMMFGINWAIDEGVLWRLHMVAIIFLSVALAQFCATYVLYAFMARVGQGVLFTLRTQMFNHIQTLSPSFFHRVAPGRIISRSQSDLHQVQETLDIMVLSVSDIFSLVGYVIVMLVIDWRLALVTLSVIPVLFLVLGYWQRFARHSFMRIRGAIALVNGEYNQNITGIRVVQSLNREEQNMEHFRGLNQEHLEANLQASRFSGLISPVIEMLTGIGLGFGVIFVGGSLVLGGDLEWGVLVAFALYIQRFFDPVRNLTTHYTQLQRAMASGARIFELLDVTPEVEDAPGAPDMPPVRGEVKFEGVSFHYVPGTEVLQDINLHVRPGENVALVGPTGAGKSTLVTLIHRFADVTKGRITVDGYDIRQVTRSSLVGQMSMVLQEPYLFSGTVGDNIRYNHETASDEDVVASAKIVGAHDFIIALEDGYDTVLAERGLNLSVGQRQLISFARAIVMDPRIIILDEATANIDTYSEMRIQNALKRVLEGRTSIVIAHRLSTIRGADKIVVLDHGRVVEVGKHQELLEHGGAYARLYAVNYGLSPGWGDVVTGY